MSEKYLHIISFDVPFPPNYGGVIDVYYKLRALKNAGVKIILHCYEYGRDRYTELGDTCEEVHYYKRNIYKNPFSGTLPYIISTRNNPELLNRLKQDNHPILFEGLHTCFFLDHEDLKERLKLVRTHNIEHEYYENLGKVEANYIKKLFFKKESERLLAYEKKLIHANYLLAISEKDTAYYKKINRNSYYLPAFHQHENPQYHFEKPASDYVVYHGNLGVGENDEAAKYIVSEIWKPGFNIPLIIAGNNASPTLRNLCKRNKNISLVSPTNTNYINQLIAEAKINLLITFQATGIKLKLIHALFQGRHCLVNREMIEDTGLEQLVCVSDAEDYQKNIIELFSTPFSAEMAVTRTATLGKLFNNQENIKILTKLI